MFRKMSQEHIQHRFSRSRPPVNGGGWFPGKREWATLTCKFFSRPSLMELNTETSIVSPRSILSRPLSSNLLTRHANSREAHVRRAVFASVRGPSSVERLCAKHARYNRDPGYDCAPRTADTNRAMRWSTRAAVSTGHPFGRGKIGNGRRK